MCSLSSNTYNLSNIKCPVLWLFMLFLNLCLSAAGSVHDLTKIQFYPSYIHDLVEGQNASINVKVNFDKNVFQSSQYYDKPLKLSLKWVLLIIFGSY